MKILIIILIGILLVFIVFQSYVTISTNNTEKQNYRLVKKYNDFEIRYYPTATLATIQSNAKTYKELASPGFRNLAGYIFGGNDQNQQISMTAPVQMDINDSVSKMSFVMPSNLTTENLPKPTNENVKIQTSAAEYVAVLKYGGFTSEADLSLFSEKLLSYLKENQITTIGNCRLYGYNPPYQLFFRTNEIVIKVEWKE